MCILFFCLYFIYHIIFIYSIDIQPDLPIIRSCSLFFLCLRCMFQICIMTQYDIQHRLYIFRIIHRFIEQKLSSKFNSFNDFLWFISSSPLLYRYNTCKEELFSFIHMITQNLYIYHYIPLSSFIRHVFIYFL